MACFAASGCAKNSRICCCSAAITRRVDAVAHDLEEAPLPAGRVDGAARLGPLGISDVDDGKLL